MAGPGLEPATEGYSSSVIILNWFRSCDRWRYLPNQKVFLCVLVLYSVWIVTVYSNSIITVYNHQYRYHVYLETLKTQRFKSTVSFTMLTRCCFLFNILSIGKTQNVSEIIVYNPFQQKHFFVDVTLKSSMAHYRLMMFGYFATFSSSKRHPNCYLVAQNIFGYCNFLGHKRSFT